MKDLHDKYILALDQGTTSSRAIVFNNEGKIVGLSHQEFPQIYPQSGWVEHDPTDILSSQLGVIPEALIRAKITAKDICAIGITNQRETTILWDRITGNPIYNAIVWQCRRTSDYCEELKNKGLDKLIYDKTGLVLDAYFSATKIKWILDNVEGARKKAENGQILFGTIDTYLMWKLSGGKIHATDYTNASRTMIFNIHTLKWDEELLQLFNIPKCILPEVHPSSYYYGNTDFDVCGMNVGIRGVCGDQQSALFGQLAVNVGDVKNTYGTGCFLLMNTGKELIKSNHGLVTSICASTTDDVDYCLEGSVFVGGAIVQWLRDEMKIIEKASDTETIALSVTNTNGVYIIPAFVGLGAPYWNSSARGIITGLTRGTNKNHIVRASLEAIAYQVSDIIEAMQKDSKKHITSLNVDGGACKNNFLLQFQSDILNCEVNRPENVEVTALGVCYLAGLNIGYYPSIEELKKNKLIEKTFTPSVNETKRNELLNGWKNSIEMLNRR